MDVTLQKHGAKHIYKVPEGLRELCSDISREVLRMQPENIYSFIADYVDTLLITRENAKVAVKVVNNILSGSQTIMNILYHTGLSLEQIATAAPRIQNAFRAYLDAIDTHPDEVCENVPCEERSKSSLRSIFERTGITLEQAERAATVIQSAFRGHYTRMQLRESEGKIQWQRAVINTLDILKKAGVSQEEIAQASTLIQIAYRGYYTRRNIRIQLEKQAKETEKEPGRTIQAVAWLETLFQDSGVDFEQVNSAAAVIQKAYKRYRERKDSQLPQRTISSKTMVIDAIINCLHDKVFEAVKSRADFPKELGTKEDMEKASAALQQTYKEHVRRSRMSVEESKDEEKAQKTEKKDDISPAEEKKKSSEVKEPTESKPSEVTEKQETTKPDEAKASEKDAEGAEPRTEDADAKADVQPKKSEQAPKTDEHPAEEDKKGDKEKEDEEKVEKKGDEEAVDEKGDEKKEEEKEGDKKEDKKGGDEKEGKEGDEKGDESTEKTEKEDKEPTTT